MMAIGDRTEYGNPHNSHFHHHNLMHGKSTYITNHLFVLQVSWILNTKISKNDS